jgi:hypothetical protein
VGVTPRRRLAVGDGQHDFKSLTEQGDSSLPQSPELAKLP